MDDLLGYRDRFPILQDPKSVFGLLMGKDVDLFIYDMPNLDLGFTYTKSYPVFPGLNARLTGEISAIVAENLDTVALKAPVHRLAVPDVPIPYSRPLERFVIPQVENIVAACQALMKGRVAEGLPA